MPAVSHPVGPIPRHSNVGGISLIELLVCLALGTLVSIGAIRLLLGNLATYQLVHAQIRVQESGHLALHLMARAIRAAGHVGCAHHGGRIQRGLAGEWGALSEVDITHPVLAFQAQGDGSWRPALDALPRSDSGVQSARFAGHGLDMRMLDPHSDLLAVSARVQPAAHVGSRVGTDALLATPLAGADELAPDDIVLVGDCVDSTVLRVTHVESAGGQQRLRWQSGGPIAGLPVGPGEPLYRNSQTWGGSFTTLQTLLDRAEVSQLSVGRIETTIFFVAPGLDRNALGEPLLALWQKVGTRRPTELVSGIERISIRLLVSDTRAADPDRAAQYVDAGALEAGMLIRSVHFSVLASSVEPVDAGAPLRREFSQSVALRNQVER